MLEGGKAGLKCSSIPKMAESRPEGVEWVSTRTGVLRGRQKLKRRAEIERVRAKPFLPLRVLVLSRITEMGTLLVNADSLVERIFRFDDYSASNVSIRLIFRNRKVESCSFLQLIYFTALRFESMK